MHASYINRQPTQTSTSDRSRTSPITHHTQMSTGRRGHSSHAAARNPPFRSNPNSDKRSPPSPEANSPPAAQRRGRREVKRCRPPASDDLWGAKIALPRDDEPTTNAYSPTRDSQPCVAEAGGARGGIIYKHFSLHSMR